MTATGVTAPVPEEGEEEEREVEEEEDCIEEKQHEEEEAESEQADPVAEESQESELGNDLEMATLTAKQPSSANTKVMYMQENFADSSDEDNNNSQNVIEEYTRAIAPDEFSTGDFMEPLQRVKENLPGFYEDLQHPWQSTELTTLLNQAKDPFLGLHQKPR